MKLALFAALALASTPVQEPEKVTFTEPFVGIQFSHPADWKVAKKEKDRSILTVPVPGSTEPADLEIIRTEFHADKELWQTVQVRINEQLGRQVVRQWEQEVLRVPMLFTRINYSKDGVERTTLMGLYYTRTPLKMLVRLDTRQADYENMSYVLMQALETVRMSDGSMPLTDDPSIKLDAVPAKPIPVVPPPRIIDGGKTETTVEKPASSISLKVSERDVNLLFPEGWRADDVEGSKLSLHHSELSRPIAIQLFSILDSDPARNALYKASSASLSRYLKVDSREDTEDVKNRAGATVSTVWRLGKTDQGDLATFYGVGQSGQYYFLATFEQTDMKAYRADRQLIEALMARVTLEAAP